MDKSTSKLIKYTIFKKKNKKRNCLKLTVTLSFIRINLDIESVIIAEVLEAY